MGEAGSTNLFVVTAMLAHRTLVRLAVLLAYASTLAECGRSIAAYVCVAPAYALQVEPELLTEK
jgi:hypothetical protein